MNDGNGGLSLDEVVTRGWDLHDRLMARVPRYSYYLDEYESHVQITRPEGMQGFGYYPWDVIYDKARAWITEFRGDVLRGRWYREDLNEELLQAHLLKVVDGLLADLERDPEMYGARGVRQDKIDELVVALRGVERHLGEARLFAGLADFDDLPDLEEDDDDIPLEDLPRAEGRRIKPEMYVVAPGKVYWGFGGEVHRVVFGTLDGTDERIDLRECRKLAVPGDDGGIRSIFLTPDDRWIAQIGEMTEEFAPTFEEIPPSGAIPRTDHIAAADPATVPVGTHEGCATVGNDVAPPPGLVPEQPADLLELADRLRREKKGTRARLAEMMAEHRSVTFEDLRDRVHGDSEASPGAIRKNVDRLQKEIEAHGLAVRVCARDERVFREDTARPARRGPDVPQKSQGSPKEVRAVSGVPRRVASVEDTRPSPRSPWHGEQSVVGPAP